MFGAERGQATTEWTALLLVVALVLGGAVAFGVGFAPWLAHRLKCAVLGGCAGGERWSGVSVRMAPRIGASMATAGSSVRSGMCPERWPMQ